MQFVAIEILKMAMEWIVAMFHVLSEGCIPYIWTHLNTTVSAILDDDMGFTAHCNEKK